MDERELRSYLVQFFILLIFYITCLVMLVSHYPLHGLLTCDNSYNCRITNTYLWNFQRSSTFIPDEKAYITGFGYDLSYMIINIWDKDKMIPVDILPFGRSELFTKSELNTENASFHNYLNNPENTYTLEKDYNLTDLRGYGGLITVLFMGFALTRSPLFNIWRIIMLLFRGGRF